jgi:hypothetical protein
MTERVMNPGPPQSGDGVSTGSLTHGNKMSVNEPRYRSVFTGVSTPDQEVGVKMILAGLKITRLHGLTDAEAIAAASSGE